MSTKEDVLRMTGTIKPFNANMAAEEGKLIIEQYNDNVQSIFHLISNFPIASHESVMLELSESWAVVLTSTWDNLELQIGRLSDELAHASPGAYIAAVKFLCRHARLSDGQWE